MDLGIDEIHAMGFEALLQLCESGDKYEKKAAARRLGSFKNTDAVPVLIRLLYDRSGDVYEAAVISLCAIGGDEAFLALASAVQDPDPCVRRCILQEWGLAGETCAIPFYLNGLNDVHAGVREAALNALCAAVDFPMGTVRSLRNRIAAAPLAAVCAAFKK